MGVCVACSSEVSDEQLIDDLCPNCSDEPVEISDDTQIEVSLDEALEEETPDEEPAE